MNGFSRILFALLEADPLNGFRPLSVESLVDYNCRSGDLSSSNSDQGGYREYDGYGVYTVVGGTQASNDKRAARVERRFRNFSRGASKSARFLATFKVTEISSEHTYIAQTHGSKNVVTSACRGKKHTSALYLLRVQPSSRSGYYDVYLEETSSPYVQNGTGSCSRGSRVLRPMTTLKVGTAYSLEIITGYNSRQQSFTNIKIGSQWYRYVHPVTTEEMYFRYGAYHAADGQKAVVRYKYGSYCHPN